MRCFYTPPESGTGGCGLKVEMSPPPSIHEKDSQVRLLFVISRVWHSASKYWSLHRRCCNTYTWNIQIHYNICMQRSVAPPFQQHKMRHDRGSETLVLTHSDFIQNHATELFIDAMPRVNGYVLLPVQRRQQQWSELKWPKYGAL